MKPLATPGRLSVEDCLIDAMTKGDECLDGVLQTFLANPSTQEVVQTLFDGVCYFFTESPCLSLRTFALTCVARIEGHSFMEQLLEKHQSNLAGITLCRASGQQAAIFSTDASVQGYVRYTCFDAFGFFGHSTHPTYADALRAAWNEGFQFLGSNELERWCQMPSWSNGMRKTLAIQAANSM